MNQTYVNQIRPVVYDVSDVTLSDASQARESCDIQTSLEFVNHTRQNLTIVGRDNVRMTIPPRQDGGDFQGLIITRVISYKRAVIINTHHVVCEEDKVSNTVRNAVNASTQPQHGLSKSREVRMNYRVPLSDIDQQGCLYVDHFDLLVANTNAASELFPDHPYSRVGQQRRRIQQDDQVNNLNRFSYTLYIVDRGGVFGERYLNINGQIYRVPIVRYTDDADGVYQVSSGEANISGYEKPVSRRWEFDEAEDKLGLYRTIHDAKALGDTDQQLKEANRQHDEDMAKLRNETERIKYEAQREKADYERERERLTAERQEFEHEMAREKHAQQQREADLQHRYSMREYERKDKSAERKDTSELIKFLPALFTGLMALFVAFRKS